MTKCATATTSGCQIKEDEGGLSHPERTQSGGTHALNRSMMSHDPFEHH